MANKWYYRCNRDLFVKSTHDFIRLPNIMVGACGLLAVTLSWLSAAFGCFVAFSPSYGMMLGWVKYMLLGPAYDAATCVLPAHINSLNINHQMVDDVDTPHGGLYALPLLTRQWM